jgi:hypothetical protein
MFIFLDESGQFTKHNHDGYFVVGTFTVGKQSRTNKEFRKWVKTKFPRKMRHQSEIKWSASGITDDLRLKTLRFIASLDVRIRFGFLLRRNISGNYRKKGKIDSGNLYTNIIGEILEQYLPADELAIHIFCDQRSLKGMTKKEFEIKIKEHLLPFCAPATCIQVAMIDSTANANIQIADWLSGALARYLEKGKLGEDCYKILKNNFLSEGKEFFKAN